MHGVIFTSFRDYLVSAHGNDTATAVFGAEPEYLLSESYPDDGLLRLVELASAHTGLEPDELFFELGVFTAEVTFARLYPAFFDVCPSTRDFLLTVETRIHELVRATIPNAGPPHLDITPLGDKGVSIVYASPRRMCVLLRGLTEGASRPFLAALRKPRSMCARHSVRHSMCRARICCISSTYSTLCEQISKTR